ncbi:class I SAM-dependent methyltransferase [Kribbia dieselivorans]|uniref:class I SAM-dependent methyltransferase n=1 Tax=Kribbia dieselivorans TaxID=331526 RepID=UPI0008387D3A|nr:class I SAM-dependent methyltransferase [Kribbia dieselivorans]
MDHLEPTSVVAARTDTDQDRSIAANRAWWDEESVGYLAEHGEFLGDRGFMWGPEGWTEDQLRVLGDPAGLAGLRVLEFGCGAAQVGRWFADRGAVVVSTDLSAGMLRRATELNARTGVTLPLAQCDATRLPFADGVFDLVVSAYGAVPFVADSAGLMAEAARVLRPGGTLAFSTTHPVRWALPDVPDEGGLRVTMSYFDRTPYVESAPDGRVVYAEHHRTLGDRVREIVAAGLTLVDLVEPEWNPDNPAEWGGWSPLRGRLIPGTAIFVARRPG